ncbi:MAG TPA: DUF3164 family protein [Ferruginibacter sp.]|nr:DUF3164 family protein [Ferruginibacter sp.]HRO17946.1 DUF3164 family protein [Ferruginibacter sp.]
MSIKIHTTKDATWRNAAGDSVPVKFVPKADRIREAHAAKIHKAAIHAEKVLQDLHSLIHDSMDEIRALILSEYELKASKRAGKHKGNITWYNFDKSIKVEAEMNDIVKWDQPLMAEALAQLNQYISKSMGDAHQLISELVKSAFANSRGMIDSGKVFQLLKYEEKIKSQPFQKACQLMKAAQSIDRTKLYMRVWERMPDGQYRNINLNFSNINPKTT